MERINYTEFEGGFHQVVLEESFVLNLKTTMSFVDFQMNFAVNEQYPLYVPPEPVVFQPSSTEDDEYELETDDTNTPADVASEVTSNAESDESDTDLTPRYPYRRGRIFFPNMEQVRWVSRIQPYIDPSTGSVDYGAIDYFYKGEEDRYFLAGYWGELEILSGPPILEIDELKQQAASAPVQKDLPSPQV